VARGSVSPFEIVLTEAEGQELEKREAIYTDPYWRVVRAKIVLLPLRVWPTWISPHAWIPARRWFTAGESGSSSRD
jgi:hypothetical protein